MKLNEWIDDSGNKITLSNVISSSSKGSSGNSSAPATKTNKEKLAELFKYIENNKTPYTTNIEIVRQQDNYFRFVVTRKPIGVKEHDIELTIRHYADGSWGLEVWKITDNFINDFVWADKGNGWENLLNALNTEKLKDYINVPAPGTTIYDKLTEWLDSKGNKINIGSSQSVTKANKPINYKKRFEKLLDYHVKHSPGTVKIEIKKITNSGFHYKERFINNKVDFETEIFVWIDSNGHWMFQLLQDGGIDLDEEGDDWKDFIRIVGRVLNTPYANTPEYNSLLTEQVNISFAEDFKLYENLWD